MRRYYLSEDDRSHNLSFCDYCLKHFCKTCSSAFYEDRFCSRRCQDKAEENEVGVTDDDD